jgi:carbon starvation protein CstA
MNTLWIVLIAVVVISTVYNLYAKRVDRNVIRADRKRATPGTR